MWTCVPPPPKPPVPGCGCAEAERQSSSVVSGRCGSSVGGPRRTSSHQRAECKAASTHAASCRLTLNLHSSVPQEEKNGIELFVSSDGPGLSEPRPAEEVIQALNVRVLHRHLGHLGITEISTEVCVERRKQAV